MAVTCEMEEGWHFISNPIIQSAFMVAIKCKWFCQGALPRLFHCLGNKLSGFMGPSAVVTGVAMEIAIGDSGHLEHGQGHGIWSAT